MTTTTVDPAAFLDEYVNISVPLIILGLAFVGLIIMQVLFTLKTDSILVWIAPIFLGIGGGFGSLVVMTNYSTFEKIAENNSPYLTADQLAQVPDFNAYSVTFIFLAVLFFLSIFVSFVLGVIKAIRRHNSY